MLYPQHSFALREFQVCKWLQLLILWPVGIADEPLHIIKEGTTTCFNQHGPEDEASWVVVHFKG